MKLIQESYLFIDLSDSIDDPANEMIYDKFVKEEMFGDKDVEESFI